MLAAEEKPTRQTTGNADEAAAARAAQTSPRDYFTGLKYQLKSTLKGMRVTIQHMFHMGDKSQNEKREIFTYQYPEEGKEGSEREVAKRHRGLIYLEPSKCIMCYACVKVCPAQCIVIEGVRLKADNYMTRFTVDNSKCIFCSLCTEVCPTDCIIHGREWDYSSFKREGMVRDLLTAEIFTPEKYIESKRALQEALVIEANFKVIADAEKAAAKAAKALEEAEAKAAAVAAAKALIEAGDSAKPEDDTPAREGE